VESVSKIPLSVVVLTYNEEQNLPACLQSLKGLDSEVFVVDSGSTDRTREIATEYGARVVLHHFKSHAEQWNWALKNLPISTEWILGLDADQQVTSGLRDEIARLFRNGTHARDQESPEEKINGFYIKRRQVFRDKWIRHGGYYPKYLLKLFRRDKVRLDLNDLVDHHFYVEGRVAKLQHDIIEQNIKENDISFWIEKHNRYATLIAREELKRGSENSAESPTPSPIGDPDRRTLWLKHIWLRLPLYFRPFFYFVYRYFFRLGFLDAKEGFIFHFLQGFWFRLLVDIKLDELRKQQRSEVRNNQSTEHGAAGSEQESKGIRAKSLEQRS
jgi:glycosyltransferase involved in cell wall biosynthesis